MSKILKHALSEVERSLEEENLILLTELKAQKARINHLEWQTQVKLIQGTEKEREDRRRRSEILTEKLRKLGLPH
jgi:Tfp pilus assembly protein PilN